jgi:hypothetical protein
MTLREMCKARCLGHLRGRHRGPGSRKDLDELELWMKLLKQPRVTEGGPSASGELESSRHANSACCDNSPAIGEEGLDDLSLSQPFAFRSSFAVLFPHAPFAAHPPTLIFHVQHAFSTSSWLERQKCSFSRSSSCNPRCRWSKCLLSNGIQSARH